MAEQTKTELRVRLSRQNLAFLEHYAAARHLTAAKIIDLSLSRLRESEDAEEAVASGVCRMQSPPKREPSSIGWRMSGAQRSDM